MILAPAAGLRVHERPGLEAGQDGRTHCGMLVE